MHGHNSGGKLASRSTAPSLTQQQQRVGVTCLPYWPVMFQILKYFGEGEREEHTRKNCRTFLVVLSMPKHLSALN